MKISAILLAAGGGERLKSPAPKAFVKTDGREMFLHSLELFENSPEISEIILVVPKSEISLAKKLTADFQKISKIVAGGNFRQKSLEIGLQFCSEKIVLSHNAANPFATKSEISRLASSLKKYDAAGAARRADSTVRLETKTLPRQKIWLMETPQIAKKDFLERGLKIANSQKIETTDEIQLAELAGARIKILAADSRNRKITRPGDLPKENRVGLGHDSHKFSEKKKSLILGGVRISPTGGLQANSDGDVILHALTNAISTALGGGSLSTFSDAMCGRGVKDSQKYLAVVLTKLKKADFTIENLAISIEGSRPILEKHFPKIRKNLSKMLALESSRIGLVATTGEGLTAFGRGEGLQVFVVVLLKSL
ncbi:2-C-methyl-D-erythritol 2,4-cyclodiphosphate synthase [Candidatus Gracilibacteria bacterium]|nr:2-C-methyl-D-erythritol 2,4-cyclodiphosphate synthase [Candidatus Gracilibacteria bacterium]MCF7856338.1 2-C-methyl-D-erythritol 2,4-cyclodiphosphate synthase [Candidatus Gracilibacteria bacterium]MCF7896727.1 2-C-methyl-D-erythritol 2,4-cyclodiphosphate synthase [Candidatus Gracilibacteria bacterium]